MTDCVEEARGERIVVTREGNPVALIIGIDGEQLALGSDASLLFFYKDEHSCMPDEGYQNALYDKQVTVRLTFGKRLYSLSLYGVKLKTVEKKRLEETQWIFI